MCANIFKKETNDHNNGHHAVPPDFFLLPVGRYLAFRLSAFTQESQQTVKWNEKKEVVDSPPRSFVLNGIDLFVLKKTRRNMYFNQIKNLTPDNVPNMVSFTSNFQKNNKNGQKISLVKDDNHPFLCPVWEDFHIKTRVIHHHQTAPDQPVAFFH